MALFAVFGNPIAHSLSPRIHQAFAAEEGRRLDYQPRLAPLDGFAAAVGEFIAQGGVGANVTLPFKTAAFSLADEHTERAESAGAVNTLFWRNGRLLGDNTDGIGLVRALTQLHGYPLRHKHILLLGAGGAARGVIGSLLQQQPASLTLANRTLANAQQLAAVFGLGAVAMEKLQPQYDIIINATSGSLQAQALPLSMELLARAELAYDMMYAAQPTVFLQQAQQAGCGSGVDGLGMLVAQAAASYELWHGFNPDIQPVWQQLRQTMVLP